MNGSELGHFDWYELFDPVLLEEIRVARENMGKYTRKTSNEYEDPNIVKTRDYKTALVKLMQEVWIKKTGSCESVELTISSSHLAWQPDVLGIRCFVH